MVILDDKTEGVLTVEVVRQVLSFKVYLSNTFFFAIAIGCKLPPHNCHIDDRNLSSHFICNESRQNVSLSFFYRTEK